MKNWFQRRFLSPLRSLLRQGMAPPRLALCVSIAIVVGNIPILGVSTIACTLLALSLRLNLPTMQLVQAAMAPTQVFLIIPFMRLGEFIVHAPPQPMSVKAGLALISQGVWHAVVVLRDAIFHAGLAWALLAPLLVYLFHRLLTPIFERMAAQLKRTNGAAPVDGVTPVDGATPIASTHRELT